MFWKQFALIKCTSKGLWPLQISQKEVYLRKYMSKGLRPLRILNNKKCFTSKILVLQDVALVVLVELFRSRRINFMFKSD